MMLTIARRAEEETAHPTTETLFAVPDMRCAGCISKLENGLILNPGIVAARVNFTAKRVAVRHDASIPLPRLIGAFNHLGFEAQAIDDQLAPDSDADSKALLRAVAVAGFAMMNIMLLSVSVWSGADGNTRTLFHWLSALIALPTVAYAGRPFFRSAWRALRSRRTNMDVPISIGVLLTTALSLYETAIGAAHAYFDGVVMLLFFLLCGRWLDSVMRDRARQGVTALLRNMGTGAEVISDNGASTWVDATALRPGMVMRVAAGERLSADGRIERGATSIDMSLLTGESLPVPASVGDIVNAGTLNLTAPIEVHVTAAGPDTAIADIARLMGEAAQSKSRFVRIADRAARLYAPAVHSLALAAFFGWMIAGVGWHQSVLIAVAVLIITCPCALGLAVPAAQIVTSGALMRAGVLVKDGSALERMAQVDHALFDKTGTLTLGRPEPENIDEITPERQAIVLALAQTSRHPLSTALSGAIRARGVLPAAVNNLREDAGFGISGRWRDHNVSLGRPGDAERTDAMATSLIIDGVTQATISFADALRPDAAETVATLRDMGIASAVLSGDRPEAVAPVARALGLNAEAGQRPEEKLAIVQDHARAGRRVLMVGDGMNDGPALAAGHASMAPSSASDAGKNAADFIFMGDSLMPVAAAIRASRRTQAIVRQNFVLAIGYNLLAVPLALAGLVTPMIAALAMSGSSIIVVANAMRLRSAGR